MPRALLREAQMRDADVLSESEHRFEAHRDLVVSGTLTVSGTQGKAVFCTEDFALKMTENDNLMVYADPDASVDLYYNGTKKFETTNDGVSVSGSVTATTYYGDGSNLTGIVTGGNYLEQDGSTQLTGNWNFGSYTISGTGDIYANAYYGDGSNLTGITASASGALLQDGSTQLTSDWNFGGNNITGTGNFTAAKITAEVDTGGTYDSTTVAAIFGDSDAVDNIYIIGNTINTAFNSATDTASMWLNYRGHNGGTANYRDLLVGDGKGAVKLRLDGSAGTIRLNEAGAVIDEFSTDDTLAGDSDTALPTEKAVKTYVDNAVATISGGGGASTFLELTDTPGSYPSPPASGSGDSYLKTTSSGVEFQVIYYYGTGDPPAAEGLPEGTLYFKYTE